MIYRKVGKISEKISVIGIGCWNFGGDWDSMDDKKSSRIIHAAIEKGINFFDVAPVYGFGHSEMVLGAALKEGSHRNKVLIASKGGLFDDSKTLSKLIGRPTTTLAESVSHLFNVNN